MKAKPFLIGLSAGMIGGTIAVVFSAPQSGKTLRTNLTANWQSSKDIVADFKVQIHHVKEAIFTLSTEAKSNIPKIINELKNNIQTFKTEIEPISNQLQQEIDSLQKSIEEIEKNLNQIAKKDN